MSTEKKFSTILAVIIWVFFGTHAMRHMPIIAWPIMALVSGVFGYVIAVILRLTSIPGFRSSFFLAWVLTLGFLLLEVIIQLFVYTSGVPLRWDTFVFFGFYIFNSCIFTTCMFLGAVVYAKTQSK